MFGGKIMRIAIIGGKASDRVKSTILENNDEYVINCFNNIPDFIAFISQRSVLFDRVLLLSLALDKERCEEDCEGYFREFFDFFHKSCYGTRLVFMCFSTKQPIEYAKAFDKVFNSTVYSSFVLEKPTSRNIYMATNNDISDIIKNFSTREEVEFKSRALSTGSDKKEENESQNQEVQKPKKKGILGGIFGGKKKKGTEKETTITPQPTVSTISKPEVEKTENEENLELNSSESISHNETEVKEEIENSETESGFEEDDFGGDTSHFENMFEDDSTTENSGTEEFFSENSENFESNTELSDDTFDGELEDETEELEKEDNFDFSSLTEDIDTVSTEKTDRETQSEVEEAKNTRKSYAWRGEESLEEEENNLDDFEEESEEFEEEDIESVDEIDDNIDIFSDNQKLSQDFSGLDNTAEQVSSDDIDIDLGQAQRELLESKAPKVIEKEVVREVIVGGKGSAVKSILKGENNHVLVVTGDRGSGVTSFCMAVVKRFAGKAKLLLVDLDVDYHGMLDKIDYHIFSKYDDRQRDAVKFVKNIRGINELKIAYGNKLDLLTTDYGVEVSEDEIIDTQAAVADCARDYNLIIVDVPIRYLHLCEDIISNNSVVYCVDWRNPFRGLFNLYSILDSIKTSNRCKRALFNKAKVLGGQKIKYKDVAKAIDDTVEFEQYRWTELQCVALNKDFDVVLNSILEA